MHHDLIVIGGGTAGLVAAIGAAGVGARVVLIERERTGGDCLWTGCVPSKALIAAARRAHDMRHADAVGLSPVDPDVDLSAVMAHVHGARDAIAPHDSPERLRREGVDVVHGEARLLGGGHVAVRTARDTRTLRGRSILIATGSRPAVPPLPGLDASETLTSDTLWDLSELPRRLVVLGGGPLGCELGQAFQRLGSDVTLVEQLTSLLPREEPHARATVADSLTADGVTLRLGTRATAVETDPNGGRVLVTDADGPDGRIGFDRILVAVGRRPSTAGLGLDAAGVDLDDAGHVVVGRDMRTSATGVFAAGDVTGGLLFTHVAAQEASVVVTNALFGLSRRAGTSRVPWVTFTDPEVARVGVTEAEARDRYDDVTVRDFPHTELDRAVVSGTTRGSARLVGDAKGRIVGATVVGEAAGESIAEIVAWMHNDGGLGDVGRTIHAYPTFAEGASRAGLEHLRATWMSPRVRLVTRPILTLLRWLDRLRRRRQSPIAAA